MSYNLYGLEKSETRDYMETLLLSESSMERIEQIKIIAAKDGFHSFRIAKVDLNLPDFTKTLNTRKS